MLQRYGKPADDILGLKQSFFHDNERLLSRALQLADSYASGPDREACKNCAASLGEPAFTKHRVRYHICARCTHVNGAHDDTEAFTDSIYTEDGGAEYAANYDASSRSDYDSRVERIYLPKARFLLEALRQGAEDDAAVLDFADLGAGSGYFVAAMLAAGARSITGYDVSATQIELANSMIPGHRLVLHDPAQTLELAGSIDSDVVSMIGVLEHVREPREILARLCDNDSVRWVFISVPTFGLSPFLEMAFADVYPRHLSGAHTHLYTDASLGWLEQEFGMTRAAEWWFGTDMIDLLRSLSVTIRSDTATEGAADLLTDALVPAVDDMQMALDRRHLASEAHLLWSVPSATR